MMIPLKKLGLLVLAFGLLLVATQTFAVADPSEILTVGTLQTWGWVFSAMGLAMMHFRVPPAIGRVWAIAVIGLIAYIVANSMGWVS